MDDGNKDIEICINRIIPKASFTMHGELYSYI